MPLTFSTHFHITFLKTRAEPNGNELLGTDGVVTKRNA